ncbi:glucosaminidase domain-containing protein [Salimicrobium flavidum]|uniref:Beta-N-acetylglucosaminidase n=1 Tax=Salimicrobium flavidum TaxID=570947 RepID=A0A1N7J0L0_9BACI|nr:glucosaminidase domain-containing protein [Salimicrobium flavidum]SIS42922.1 Beta-N-acetylglucosaminidase [Salimicrobium flavidum]
MRWFGFFLFAALFLGFATCAQAETKEWGEKINVAPDKTWKIEFNTELERSSVNDFAVMVEDENEIGYPVTVTLMDDDKTVKVEPETDYLVDTKYTLHIVEDRIKAKHGKNTIQNKVEMPFYVSKEFQLVTLDSLEDWDFGTSYDSLSEGVANAGEGQVIIKNGNIFWAPEGSQLVTNAFTIFYTDASLGTSSTYVNGQVELNYVRSRSNAIEAELAGKRVFVKPEDVTFIPEDFQKIESDSRPGASYYRNVNGTLQHTIYRALSNSYVTYSYGKAPDSLGEGEIVTSWDGTTFNGEEATFFNNLDLRRQGHYNGEMLDEYIASQHPDSPLIGHGDAFVTVAEEQGVNALYLMAHAIHESAWGKSAIARDKNNLFGIDAVDGNAYDGAMVFESFEGSIRYLAEKKLTTEYLVEKGEHFNGYTLGNKSTGMNVKYASDPYWGQKIAGHMYRADQYLGGHDQKLLEDENYEVTERFGEDEENSEEKPEE